MCETCSISPTAAQATALSRRRMLGAAAGVGVAALAGVASTGVANAAEPTDSVERHGSHRIPVENISIQLYTLAALMNADVDGTLAGLARIGFQRVEHAGIPAGLTARQFREKLDRHGLRATSGHNTPPSDPFDPVAWAKVLDDARILGQKTVNQSAVGITGFDPVKGITYLQTAAEWRHLCDVLNQAGKMAHEAGMGFGLHNHFWEFLPLDDSPLVGEDILIQYTDPRYVHFETDLWAWYGHHDPVQLVLLLQKRLQQFHVKDMKVLAADEAPPSPILSNFTWADPGTGIIDFARIFAAKKGSRHHTEFIIERDDAGAAALHTAEVGFHFLKDIRF